MKPGQKSETPAQGLTQFQLEGDAADRYERWAVPFVIGPWAAGLVDLAGLRQGHRVLDVATGTGVVARLAARQVAPEGTVTGLDLNEGMLTAARRLPLPPGLTIDWRHGSALALPFSDGDFDAVLCLKALHEFRRVLAPNGRVTLGVWTGPSPYFAAQREGLARHVSSEAATSIAAAFTLGNGNELRGLLETAGFHDVIVHHVRMMLRLPVPEEFLLRHLSAMPVAELVAAAGEGGRAGLIAHMTEAMSPYVDGYGVVVPQEINVATGLV